MNKKAQTTALVIIAVLVIGFIIFAFASGGDTSKESGKECSTDAECDNEMVCSGFVAAVSASTDTPGTEAVKGKCRTSETAGTLKGVFDGVTNEKLDLNKSVPKILKGSVEFLFKYIFGMHSGILAQLEVQDGNLENLSIRGVMILVAVWVIFLLVFGDMAVKIGFFSNKSISFFVGFGVTIIFANFGLYYDIIIWLIGIFAFAAGLSVIFALFSIIILGVGAHFGAGWVLTVMQGQQNIRKARSGGAKTVEGIKVAKKMAEAAAEGE